MLIIGIIIAIICFIFAYLIWCKEQLWLISGSTEKVKEKDKLEKYMGIFLITSGIYFFILFGFVQSILLGIVAYALLTIIFRVSVFIKIK